MLSVGDDEPARMLSVGDEELFCAVQYADQGFLEVDGTLEWDNDYPNPVRPLPGDSASA